jgi:hypothetical protein
VGGGVPARGGARRPRFAAEGAARTAAAALQTRAVPPRRPPASSPQGYANPWRGIRIGRLLEDLDSLAGSGGGMGGWGRGGGGGGGSRGWQGDGGSWRTSTPWRRKVGARVGGLGVLAGGCLWGMGRQGGRGGEPEGGPRLGRSLLSVDPPARALHPLAPTQSRCGTVPRRGRRRRTSSPQASTPSTCGGGRGRGASGGGAVDRGRVRPRCCQTVGRRWLCFFWHATG